MWELQTSLAFFPAWLCQITHAGWSVTKHLNLQLKAHDVYSLLLICINWHISTGRSVQKSSGGNKWIKAKTYSFCFCSCLQWWIQWWTLWHCLNVFVYVFVVQYDIVGHSGDGFNIALVPSDKVPKDNKQRLEILKVNFIAWNFNV